MCRILQPCSICSSFMHAVPAKVARLGQDVHPLDQDEASASHTFEPLFAGMGVLCTSLPVHRQGVVGAPC